MTPNSRTRTIGESFSRIDLLPLADLRPLLRSVRRLQLGSHRIHASVGRLSEVMQEGDEAEKNEF